MSLKFYNTFGKEKQEFKPINKGEVLMYNCGPTVYDYSHIGNFRAYVFADTLRRYLEYSGYRVKQVINITDVGHLTEDELESGIDKMEKAAKREGKTALDIANFYTEAFLKDWNILNLEEPIARPKATEYIKEMIELIQVLLEKGFAYEKNGSVYFEVEKFPEYGALSGNSIEKLEAGRSGRVEKNPDKKNQLDFALWVNDPKHIMTWESPWSKGYPGWHIECSVMSSKLLGKTIDIHTGGEDNIFPHHDSEIAQSEAANGKKFVNYWLHPRHLLVNGEKMSKSKGNFFTVTDLLQKGFSPKAIRYVLFAAQYRTPMNLTLESLKDAETTLSRLFEFMQKLEETKDGTDNPKTGELIETAKNKFKEAMDDDLNTSLALAAIHEFVSEINKAIAEGKLSKKNAGAIRDVMLEFDKVLGLNLGEKEVVPVEVKKLAEERENARKEKNFKRSDELRDEIKKRGWEAQDTPEGQKLRKRI